jgi:hypothetical protein
MPLKSVKNIQFFLSLGLIFICAFIVPLLTNDLYLKGISRLTCIQPLEGFGGHLIHGHLYISNILCVETKESFSQMYTFYKSKGWFCDAGVSCMLAKTSELGLFSVITYKRSSYSHTVPGEILFYEEYQFFLNKETKP